jgi:hypothetical protein
MRTIVFLSCLFATAFAIPSASLSSEAAPSTKPRAHIKIALPDGLGPEDAKVVPMMDLPAFLRKPISRHESHEKGYKNLELQAKEAIMITPFQSEEQKAATIPKSRRYKQLFGVKDTGEARLINIPTTEIEMDEELNPSVMGKSLVGVDNFGRKRYLDIPYYNRAASNTD